MKRPTLQIQEPQPKNIQRADIAPANGFAMVVDGHFKTKYNSEAAASKAAAELLALFPMLRIEIYNCVYRKPKSGVSIENSALMSWRNRLSWRHDRDILLRSGDLGLAI